MFYNIRIFYLSLMITTRENPVIITQKNISQSILIAQDIKTQRQQDKKQGTMNLQNQDTNFKMIIVSHYLSIITLNISG